MSSISEEVRKSSHKITFPEFPVSLLFLYFLHFDKI